MLSKGLFLGLLLVALSLAASPASAVVADYTVLVVAPSGYTYDGSTPEITVVPSDQFILELSIWTDLTGQQTGGLNAYIYYDPDLAKAKDENGVYDITTVVNPVDDENKGINWQSSFPKNEGNNSTGKISYEQQTLFTDPQSVPQGKTHLGWVEFHCEGNGDVSIYPGEGCTLINALAPGELLTGLQGTMVHQGQGGIIPEPATLLLLGSGLVMSGFAYRRKHRG